MFSVSFSWDEIWLMGLFLGIALIPVVAATFLSHRSFRRGWWLAGPGGLFFILSPLLSAIFYASGAAERADSGAFVVSMAMFLAGWIATGLFLATLAIAGPKLPVLDVREVF